MSLYTLLTKPRAADAEKTLPAQSVDRADGSKFQIPDMQRNWRRAFPSHGQGTLVFHITRNDTFLLAVRDEIDGKPSPKWIGVLVTETGAALMMGNDESQGIPHSLDEKDGPDVALEPNKKISYWLSYDRDNMVVKYGKGYRMTETTKLSYDFLEGATTEKEQDERRKQFDDLFNPSHDRWGEQYDVVKAFTPTSGSLMDIEDQVQFDYTPMIRNPPPVVLDVSKVTMMVLDDAEYTTSASLPAACQELYRNVINCDLDWEANIDGVKFSDAIRHSIDTDGCILNKKLKEKIGELGSDPNETYIRITLGFDNGGSPGVPYVLEIWPKQHYSAIHNHGNAHAVIKVLHGGLRISIYNKLTEIEGDVPGPAPDELLYFDAKKDNVTWLAPRWYQVHKLHNNTGDYCATLQCYKFARDDPYYWPYFDYLSDENQIDEFIPKSDFTFRKFKADVIAEYKASL